MVLHVLVIHFREYLSGIVVITPLYLISGGLPWESKQWGVSAGSYGDVAITVNFPVAFSEFKAVVGAGYQSQQKASSQTNLQIDTGNLAYIRVWPNNEGFGWIAIGR